MSKRRNQHVVPKDGQWAVQGAGASRATALHDTQAEAAKHAREIAQRQRTEVIVHGRNGRIRERDSFGSDPFPPKG